MDSKRIQKNIKTLQNIISSSTFIDESVLNGSKWPSKIKQQCKKESLKPMDLDFEHSHYIYQTLCLLLGGESEDYKNYIVDFQNYINLDYELGNYIETLEEKSVDELFEFIFLLSLFPTISCFASLSCDKCKSLCSGYIDQCNAESICACRKSQIKLLRVLYEKQGSLKSKNLPIISTQKGINFGEVDKRERASVYIHQGKIVPLIEYEVESSSEESIELINDECDDEKKSNYQFKNSGFNASFASAHRDSMNDSKSYISNSYKERFNSAKEIGHLHNDFNNSTANRTFNENQFDDKNKIDNVNKSMRYVPLAKMYPPPGLESK